VASGRLPTTLAADDSGGGLSTKITFERVIVFPDGHREIEGVTPKQLPAPKPIDASQELPNFTRASPTLPNEPGFQDDHKENKDLES
jgi:hypothetical protein